MKQIIKNQKSELKINSSLSISIPESDKYETIPNRSWKNLRKVIKRIPHKTTVFEFIQNLSYSNILAVILIWLTNVDSNINNFGFNILTGYFFMNLVVGILCTSFIITSNKYIKTSIANVEEELDEIERICGIIDERNDL